MFTNRTRTFYGSAPMCSVVCKWVLYAGDRSSGYSPLDDNVRRALLLKRSDECEGNGKVRA